MERSEARNWLALCLVRGLGPVGWLRLHHEFGGPDAILGASVSSLRQAGAGDKVASAIASFNEWDRVDQGLDLLDGLDARMVSIDEPEYPEALRQMHDPPPVLFVRGKLTVGDEMALAVVGTRKAGEYGLHAARMLSYHVAASGVTIISGLALGIDAQAHWGAINAKGRTVAVLGSGLDAPGPAANRELADGIADNGAIVTEFPPQVAPHPGNFPRRNRIIAGLSTAILVVESPKKSGSLITVKYALEQGKEVLVVPGRIDDPNFEGSHQLIREGAKPVFHATDILEIAVPEAARRMETTEPFVVEVSSRKAKEKLPADLARVYGEVGVEPIDVDAVARKAGLTSAEVLSILLELELRNLVQQLPGKRYKRTE